jgi:glycosyltransferase involved in cell wall biosynthesis
VIPLFNKEQAIGYSIQSVLRQDTPPNELIIVDDGSTDRSAQIVTELLSGSGGNISWRIISQEQAGVSAARNKGATEARGRYIAFLDADDEWLPGYLSEIERLALHFPSATFLSTRSARTNAVGTITPEPTALPTDFFGLVEHPLATYRKGFGILNASSVAIRDDAWQRSPGFPTGYSVGEDMFLWLYLCLSEVLAHSSAALSIYHTEYSTLQLRKGLVGYHFTYFLGTPEGRALLANGELVRFLCSNLLGQIVERRLIGDSAVQIELTRLSRALPWSATLKCHAAAAAPLSLLRIADWARKALWQRSS